MENMSIPFSSSPSPPNRSLHILPRILPLQTRKILCLPPTFPVSSPLRRSPLCASVFCCRRQNRVGFVAESVYERTDSSGSFFKTLALGLGLGLGLGVGIAFSIACLFRFGIRNKQLNNFQATSTVIQFAVQTVLKSMWGFNPFTSPEVCGPQLPAIMPLAGVSTSTKWSLFLSFLQFSLAGRSAVSAGEISACLAVWVCVRTVKHFLNF